MSENNYSLRPIILFANIDVSRHILVVDTSVLVKSNMGRREYKTFIQWVALQARAHLHQKNNILILFSYVLNKTSWSCVISIHERKIYVCV
jgi:hypothetical protein